MTDTTMVERVARALCHRRSGRLNDCRWGCTIDTDCLGPISQPEMGEARAAIEAIPEPGPIELALYDGDECIAIVNGPREDVLREIAHYRLMHDESVTGSVYVEQIIRIPFDAALNDTAR